MRNLIQSTLAVACLVGISLSTMPADAAGSVGVHIGDLGVSIGNGHYYDRHHRRQAYTYPSDWKSYNHPQSWYRGHAHWNDQQHSDWYRH
jgi:hypothetical protein